MAVKSNLGEPSVPKPGNQGSAAKTVHTQKPLVQADAPGGHLASVPLGDQAKRRGVRPKPQGGSGNGLGRGNKLPR